MAKSRPKSVREMHREKVFHWRTMNIPYAQIAQNLGIGVATAAKDYQIAAKQFREHWQCEESEKRARFLEGILAVAREAWDNYKLVKNNILKDTVEGKETTKFAKIRMDRNLSLVLKALKQGADLLGVEAPKRLFLSTGQEERKRFIEMLDGIEHSIEGPSIDIGMIEVENELDEGSNGSNGSSKR